MRGVQLVVCLSLPLEEYAQAEVSCPLRACMCMCALSVVMSAGSAAFVVNHGADDLCSMDGSHLEFLWCVGTAFDLEGAKHLPHAAGYIPRALQVSAHYGSAHTFLRHLASFFSLINSFPVQLHPNTGCVRTVTLRLCAPNERNERCIQSLGIL